MTIILGFLVMLVLVTIMAVGVILGRKPISGSCGGLSALGMKQACDICGGVDRCEKDELENDATQESDFYDATKKRP